MNTLRLLLIAAVLTTAARAATPLTDVQMAGANNQVKSGATFTVVSGGTFTLASGSTINAFASSINWAAINKAGSSLADLATRSAGDLNSGTLPDGRFPATLPTLNGSLLTSLNASALSTGTVLSARLPLATTLAAGAVIPDGTTITVAAGVISSVPGFANPMTTAGDIITGGTSGAAQRLGIGTTGQILTTVAGAPAWADAAVGFTNPMTTAGDIIMGGTSGAAQRLGIGTVGQVLTTVAGAPAWADASGGFSNPMTTAGDIIVGGTSGAAGRLGAGTDGQVLKLVSGAPAWGTDSTGSGSLPATPAAGDLAYYDGANWISRAIGTAGHVLTVSSGTPAWAANSAIGKKTIFVPAAAMTPSVTAGCAYLAVAEISAGQPDIAALNFDAATQQYAQFTIAMPKSWDLGTVTVEFRWSHPTASTNYSVVWSVQGVAVSDGDTLGTAFGTAQNVTDTGGTANTLYVSAATSAVTIGGTPATGDSIVFRVSRVAADASDTLAVVARLHGVRILYTTNAANDD